MIKADRFVPDNAQRTPLCEKVRKGLLNAKQKRHHIARKDINSSEKEFEFRPERKLR